MADRALRRGRRPRPAATAASAAGWRRTRRGGHVVSITPGAGRPGEPRATPASRAASRTSSPAPADRLTAPLVREAAASARRPGTRRSTASPRSFMRIKARARPRRDRRPRLVARHERGVLRDAARRPRRDRHAQHRQLLARLPLADLVRRCAARSASRAAPAPSPTSSAPQVLLLVGANPTAAHPVAGARMKQAALARHEARHRRPAPDRARRPRRPPLRPPPGDERRLPQRARARARSATGSSTSASSRSAPRASTRSPTLVADYTPGRGRADHRRPGRRRRARRAPLRRGASARRSRGGSASPSTCTAPTACG